MSAWISLKDGLPELGTLIWARFSKTNGEARRRNPVREGDYDRSPYDDNFVGFIFGEHRNIAFSVDDCPEAGITHWQPRVDATPPSPELDAAPAVPVARQERAKRHYQQTSEGRAKKQAAIREYWRRRREGVDG